MNIARLTINLMLHISIHAIIQSYRNPWVSLHIASMPLHCAGNITRKVCQIDGKWCHWHGPYHGCRRGLKRVNDWNYRKMPLSFVALA